MHAFNSRREGNLTCRHWLLDPAGCRNNQCRYSHTITGAMSPPSMFACYAYNNGGCRLTQDQCLFAHLISGPESRYLQIRHPELSPRDTPIAEAAAKAGFDCSEWTKLKRLIEAVRTVNPAVSYPDRWTGPAAFKNPLYPDRWVANSTRLRRSVIQSYQEADKAISVPAFVVPASQIIRNSHDPSRVPGTPQLSTRTPSNRTPRGPRHGTKRRPDDLIDLGSSYPKRARTEAPTTPALTGSSQTNCIDLTADTHPTTSIPTLRPPPRPPLATVTNNAPLPAPPKRLAIHPKRLPHEPKIHRETTAVLAKIASKLRASAHALDGDRDTLRQRWEVDDRLKLRHVTKHLAELNECFGRAESGILGALGVVEGRLLGDRAGVEGS